MDDTITRYISTLIPPHQLDVTLPCDKHTFFVVHTLAHTAMIHLYSRFSRDDPISYGKCLRSARSCVVIIKHVADSDFGFLDPIIGVRPCLLSLLFSTQFYFLSFSHVGFAPPRLLFANFTVWKHRGLL